MDTIKTFRIEKRYEGFPSRTNKKFMVGLNEEQASNKMLNLRDIWKKGTGRVAYFDGTSLTVIEDDDREIYFELKEE